MNYCQDFTITEEAPTRAFLWLRAPNSIFTFKTLLRHYCKQALTHGIKCTGNCDTNVKVKRDGWFGQHRFLAKDTCHDCKIFAIVRFKLYKQWLEHARSGFIAMCWWRQLQPLLAVAQLPNNDCGHEPSLSTLHIEPVTVLYWGPSLQIYRCHCSNICLSVCSIGSFCKLSII